MKLLFVHAHFDDFEFTAAGTFELWRRRDPTVQRRILVCTDGAAGHHALTREATAARRWAEQQAAAAVGGFEARLLRDRTGQAFREGRLLISPEFLPALWREIREFEPDYLFSPPVPTDPLAGIHVDHFDVAQAIRSVAYLINVPHAFTPEYPADETDSRPVRTPVILNTYDGYLATGHQFDLAVNITSVVELAADMAWCHQSQLSEWLPWVDRHAMEVSPDSNSWRRQFAERMAHRQEVLGIPVPGLFELFQVSAWGAVPAFSDLLRDFPELTLEAMNSDQLRARLTRWHQISGQ